MLKVTVLYGHPKNPEDFENYYLHSHLQLVAKMKGVARQEFTRFLYGPGGERPAFYRMAEVYFSSEAQMQETLGSAEGQAATADLARFSTGGVTIMIGSIGE